MAIVGATVGTVTNSLCIIVRPDMIFVLPLVPILALEAGIRFGAQKDEDYEEFGTYDTPGTYRLNLVFFGLRYFPKGPHPLDAVYDGEKPVAPAGRNRSPRGTRP